MLYVYRGTEFDAHLPPSPRKPRAAVAECGSTTGYTKHITANEPACEPCKEATRAYKRDWRARVKARKAAA